MDPLDFNDFFPAHVTDTAEAAPELEAPPEDIALLEDIAPEVIAPPEDIALEVIAPLEVIPLLEAALGALVGAATLEEVLVLELGVEALLLLPHAASNATHTVMTPAAMLVLFRLTWFSSEEIRDLPAAAGRSRDVDRRITPPGRAFAASGSLQRGR